MPCSPGRRSRTREQTVSISSASACDALTAISTPPSKPFSERLAYLDPARARGAAAQLGTEPPASARLWQENRRKAQARPAPEISLLSDNDRRPSSWVACRGPAGGAPLGQRCTALGRAWIGSSTASTRP